MANTQPVNIKVINIEKADADNFFKVYIKFEGSTKVYPYIRKCGLDNESRYFLVISGCRITFHKNQFNENLFTVDSITREYDVKGYRRMSTKSISRKRRKQKKSKQTLPVDTTNKTEIDDVKTNDVDEVDEKDKTDASDDVTIEEEKPVIPKKVRHEKYSIIKNCLECNIPIYLAGPAGSGKNYTVEQIARENGWNFYYTNSVQQEYKLTGFIDAGGTYQETEFYKACTDEEECIFFLDEMDASVPEALVLINAAIANGYFEFPNGRVTLGDVHFVAAGNTVGSGADELYTGRMVLDQATLDRFAIIEFDYCKNVELKLTKGNIELVNFVRELRDRAKSLGIRATFSYRCLEMVTKLEHTDMTIEDILKISVVKGMDNDTLRTLSIFGSSKYHKAYNNLKGI